MTQRSLDMLPDSAVQEIIREYEARQALEESVAKREAERKRALHLQACMDYDDEHDTQIKTPWVLRPFWHRLGFHGRGKVWNPRWVRGTYGFCRVCGVDIGGGIDESGGY